MEEFDVIVVGAGPAGAAAAFAAAKAGVGVLLLERGQKPGTKTVSGGLLYTHVMNRYFPDFGSQESPVERFIDRYVLGLLDEQRSTCVDFFDPGMSRSPYNCASVLRSKLDPWLVSKAESAGATVALGVRVDGLIRSQGKISGVLSSGDEFRSKVVIQCDGFNSLLSRDIGLHDEWQGKTVGIGIKEVIRLSEEEISRRFRLSGRSGVEYTFLGLPKGVEGGGFLYTNSDSLSLGLILNMEGAVLKGVEISEAIELFKSHPLISGLVEGGTVEEYSTCLVAEGGFESMPPLYAGGYLAAGSAAAMVLNTGFNLRGMDFAVGSGSVAGELAAEAVKAKNTSSAFMSNYLTRLKQSFVLTDLLSYKGYPKFFRNTRLYSVYPEIMNGFLHDAYFVDGRKKNHLLGLARKSIKGKVSTMRMIADVFSLIRNI